MRGLQEIDIAGIVDGADRRFPAIFRRADIMAGGLRRFQEDVRALGLFRALRHLAPEDESPWVVAFLLRGVEDGNGHQAAFSTPHQSAMNSATDCVTLRIDSMLTRSSKPWISVDFGP